jgi:hypothetical protein
MRAHATDLAVKLASLGSVVVSLLVVNTQVLAQDDLDRRSFWVLIQNGSGYLLDRGELEWRIVRNDGVEVPIEKRPTRIVRVGSHTWVDCDAEVLQSGPRYRMLYRANCIDDPTKRILFSTVSFKFHSTALFEGHYIQFFVVPDHVSTRPVRRGVLRRELPLSASSATEIFAKPGDLIQFDYSGPVPLERIEPQNGLRPHVVSVAAVPRRTAIVDDKPKFTEVFFDVKERGDDWIAVEVDGVPHKFHVVVTD